MKTWILSNRDDEIPAEKIYEILVIQKSCWIIPYKATNLKNLQIGDRVVFKRGNFFVGEANISSLPKDFPKDEFQELGSFTNYVKIELNNITNYDPPKLINFDNLSFVHNKKNYGAYFQGSIKIFPEDDYKKILEENKDK